MTDNEKVTRFARFLALELEKRHISIPQFAKKMGVAKRTPYKWLSGEWNMGLDKYYKALDILGITEQYIQEVTKEE